jgi:hypothetical protein
LKVSALELCNLEIIFNTSPKKVCNHSWRSCRYYFGALQANQSANYPSISGIILTGGIVPEDTIMKLIEGSSDIVPIASVEDGTYLIANRIGAIKSKIYADNIQKN